MTARAARLTALVACAVSACTFDRPRPAAWGLLPTPAASDCRAFEGSVYDTGESTSPLGRASLVATLFGYNTWGGKPPQPSDRASFAFLPEKKLRVTLWRDLEAKFVRETDKFECVDGRLVVENRRMAAGAGAVGHSSFVVTMTLGDDYLTAKIEESGVGIVLFAPVAATSTTWQRHRRIR